MHVSEYFEGQQSHTWEALESTRPCSSKQFEMRWFSVITSKHDEGKLDHNDVKWCFSAFS